MRRLAAALVSLAACSSLLHAQTAAPLDQQQFATACYAWRDHVLNAVRLNSGTGVLSADDASAMNGLTEILGKRCGGDDPQRMLHLFAVVLEALSDQGYQQ
ncbi:hypothetical protein [Bosea sp. BK604]|uniref:hypothetical protein n=1 Tax=Bosea sp. BK604 TaxID=2512180 RepID=UPI001048A872|nr:hypothetical protein [Bosea sp. BK604]TCR70254.1 hypothetical protein EV560_101660 [Bosea sp. BK604]